MELTDEDFCNRSTWVMYRSLVNNKELYSKCLEFIITYAKEGQEMLADELDLFFEDVVDKRIKKQDLTDSLLLEGQEVLANELYLFFKDLVDKRIKKQDLTDSLLLDLLDSGAKAVNWVEIVKAIVAD